MGFTRFRIGIPRPLLGALVILLVGGAALRAEDAGAADVSLALPSQGGVQKAPEEAALKQENKQVAALVKRKLRQAQLLYQVRKIQACIDLCDEILLLDTGNSEARGLKDKASWLRQNEATANLDSERRLRDHALLEKATEEGLPVEEGPSLERPAIGDKDMPFHEDDKIRQAQRSLLSQRLPEINLIDADLNYVLQLLFKTTGINVVYDPADLQGKGNVTFHVRNPTLEDVLKYLCRTKELGYTVDRDTVWVYAASNPAAASALMKTVVIPLRVGLTRAGTEQASNGDAGGNAGNAGNNNNNNAGGGADAEGGKSDIEELMGWMESNWPGWPPTTKWKLDKKLNRLIVCSTPDMIDEIRTMVDMLDRPPLQVLIATRFVEVNETYADQLGFNWTLTPNPDIQPVITNGTASNTSWKDNKARISTTSSNLGVSGDALTSGAVGVLNDHQLNFAMQMLQQNTGSKVLTAPRVIALNNKTAEIKLNNTYPYPTTLEPITTTTSTDTNSTSTVTVVPRDYVEEDLGYSLKVLPSVGSDMQTITLKVTPTIKAHSGDTTEQVIVSMPDGKSQAYDFKRPQFTTKELTVEAAVKDGQTIVVGGLFLDNDTDIKKSVPGLSKIPYLGNLFKSKDRSRTRSCLLIFVTARLITLDNGGYTDNAADAKRDAAKDRVRNAQDYSADELNDLLGDPRK